MYALRVNVDDLRPWEYDAMPADDYEMILHLQETFRKARALWPKGHDRRKGATG